MKRKYAILLTALVLVSSCTKEQTDYIKVAGIVDGDIFTIKAAVAGKIEALNIKEGLPVKKGDVLIEINSDKLLNQLDGLSIRKKEIYVNRKKINNKTNLLKSNLKYWKQQVERFQRLREKESISGDKLEKAELQLEEVETSLFDAQQSLSSLSIQSENISNQEQHLKLLLEDHVISSPVSGDVLEKFLSEGEIVFPGAAVADILDKESLYVEAFIEGEEISQLELGQEIFILLDGLGEKTFSGRISYFGRKAEFSPKYIISEKERKSLLYQVKIRIDKDHKFFKIGMPVTVQIKK